MSLCTSSAPSQDASSPALGAVALRATICGGLFMDFAWAMTVSSTGPRLLSPAMCISSTTISPVRPGEPRPLRIMESMRSLVATSMSAFSGGKSPSTCSPVAIATLAAPPFIRSALKPSSSAYFSCASDFIGHR